MKLSIINSENIEVGKRDLPKQFSEPYHPDLIQRAVLVLQNNRRQNYGAFSEAGKRPSARLSRRRRNYKGAYGIGISRVPRKTMSRKGTRFVWQGAFAPMTVGGRRAHPPKPEKIWSRKINKKENRKAIRSAMSATINKELVKNRCHILPEKYPFILDNSAENVKKTKDAKILLEKLGFKIELERVVEKKIRSGVGKLRSRKYRRKTGPLVVVSKDCALLRSLKNIPGVNAVIVNKLNAELLAPGSLPGRLTLFTKPAIERLEKEALFL
nr:50S ribosomal protein L4P, large subunit ribosomal protein L4e [uncultured archaeon]